MFKESTIDLLKKKTLFLIQTDPKNDAMYQEWKKKGYMASIIFKEQWKIVRLIRRIWIYFCLPALGFWLGSWKYELESYDTIILHISKLTLNLPKWIHKKYPNIRIICWYWNVVDNETKPEKITDTNVEFWSFDLQDCLKYKMKFNIQYYSCEEVCTDADIIYDIYFIGRNKGRKDQILNLQKIAEMQGLRCDFNIIYNNDKIKTYLEVKNDILKSKAILEINKKGQDGYTLRVLESLFLDKKLITNNLSILNAPFYRKNNIFVIGHDSLDDLKKFMEQPYDNTVRKYKKSYDLDIWFQNFFK